MRISDWISDVCSSDRPGPEAKQPGVGHLQDAANIGGLVAVEIEIGRRGIGVSAVAPVQHPQRDERIEEVAGAPFMEPEPPPQRLAVERSRSKLGEPRSEERRVGKECGRTRRYRWSTVP